MERAVFAFILASFIAILVIDDAHSYQLKHPLFGGLRDNLIESTVGQPSSASYLDHVEEGAKILQKQHEELEDALENMAHGTLVRFDDRSLTNDLAIIRDVLLQVLQEKGLSLEGSHEVISDVLQRLQARFLNFQKRGLNNFSVHSRFAPFGTKLVPNRKLENGGATLLRYGRSVYNH